MDPSSNFFDDSFSQKSASVKSKNSKNSKDLKKEVEVATDKKKLKVLK